MKYGLEKATMVPLDRVILNLDNPRHEPFQSQDEAIDFLCRHEYVYELAKDLTKVGPNPLELFALLPYQKDRKRQLFVVAEGNRRLCALMLLNDPELAPPEDRKRFRELAEGWKPIKEIAALVFETQEDVDLWVERIHGGFQAGIGRRSWTAEQKTRFSGDRKNILAQKVLDYAEKRNLIAPEARKGKLTTAQRFLSNVTFREALGIDASNIEDICRTRDEENFEKAVKTFVDDLVEAEVVTSRMNKKDIIDYARRFAGRAGISEERIEPVTIDVDPKKPKKRRRPPKKPQRPSHLAYNENVHEALRDIPNYKLEQLYYSICRLELAHYTPLLAVGLWSFLETLTAIVGRGNTDFPSFLCQSKIRSLNCMPENSVKSAAQAIKRISDFGNTTKHDCISAMFNDEQLANDFTVIDPIILALAKNAKK